LPRFLVHVVIKRLSNMNDNSCFAAFLSPRGNKKVV
jgi:hypothetical protein